MKKKAIVRMTKNNHTVDVLTTIYDAHYGDHTEAGYIVVDGGTLTVYRPAGSTVWYVASGHVVPFKQIEKKDR